MRTGGVRSDHGTWVAAGALSAALLLFQAGGLIAPAFANAAPAKASAPVRMSKADRRAAGVVPTVTRRSARAALGLPALAGLPQPAIPGAVTMPASPFSGTGDENTNTDNVYQVYLEKGQKLIVDMTGDAGTDFDLYLFGPAATDINNDEPVATSENDVYPEDLGYTAPDAGWYYLDVYAFSGSGAYHITWSVGSGADDGGQVVMRHLAQLVVQFLYCISACTVRLDFYPLFLSVFSD